MMIWLISGIVVIMLVALFIALKNNSLKTIYISKKPLTQPEQILYFRIKEALPNYEILAQVPFSRFIYTTGGNKKQNWSNFAKFKQKIVDYLICKKDFTIIAAIELDDKSHDKEKDKIRDQILKNAGIRIIRWHIKQLPTKEDILNSIEGTVTNEANN